MCVIVKSLLVALIPLLTVPAHAAKWETVSNDFSRSVAIDSASLQPFGRSGNVWVREIYTQTVQARPGDFYFKSLKYQVQFDCEKRTALTLFRVYYGPDGSELRRVVREPEERANAVVPDTLDERKYDWACRRIAARTNTPKALSVQPQSEPPPDEPASKEPAKNAVKAPVKAAENAKPASDTTDAKPAAKEKAEEKPARTPSETPSKSKESAEKPVAATPAKPVERISPEKQAALDKYLGTSIRAQVRAIANRLLTDNQTFAKSRSAAYFQPFLKGQKPRATVVTCSDSRVHTHAFDKTPDNDLFMVRNIGNQLPTAEGSVEYGVHHLHTPLLIFVGHSGCGAIKAAMSDYSSESPAIRKELDTLTIDKDGSVTQGVLRNVDNQVKAAMAKFTDEVADNKLAVVGAVYDFRNDLRQGFGKLVITNVNGESNPARFRTSPLLPATDGRP